MAFLREVKASEGVHRYSPLPSAGGRGYSSVSSILPVSHSSQYPSGMGSTGTYT